MLLFVVKDDSEKEGGGCAWLFFCCDVLCAFENIGISSELAGCSLLTRCLRGAWSPEECDSCLLFSHT